MKISILKLLSFGVSLLAVGSILFYLPKEQGVITISLDGKEVLVKMASSPAEREQGLKGVSSLRDFDGMLFIFDEKAKVAFWNKETLLDLELLWISAGRVWGIDFLPKESSSGLKILESPGEVEMVLELPYGWSESHGIRKGALVSLPPPLE